MNDEQEYANGQKVYGYYFDFHTTAFKNMELVVKDYDYLYYPKRNTVMYHDPRSIENKDLPIIDEYHLIETIKYKRFGIFNKEKTNSHFVKSHLISNNHFYAKIKFVYFFLKEFSPIDLSTCPYAIKLKGMIKKSERFYHHLVETEPDLLLKVITEKKFDVTGTDYWYWWR